MPWEHSGGQKAIDIEVEGKPLQLDDTDKLATSIYGKDEAAGDTPVSVNAGGEFPASFDSRILLQELVKDIKIIKAYLALIAGETLNETDIG